MRPQSRVALATSLFLVAMTFSAAAVNAQAGETADSPCLKELNEHKAEAQSKPKKKKKEDNWFKKNAEAVLGTVGAAGGVVVGDRLCKDSSTQKRSQCRALGGLGGALIGSKLGKMMSEAEKEKYQEATYKVALTGRPQSLTLEKGCLVVEPASEETFEDRQVELAFASNVAAPPKLRAVAIPYVRPAASNLSAEMAAKKGSPKVAANQPAFVMGSTDSGKWLLLGREDADQGFVAAGYVDAKGWVAVPDSTPAPPDNATGQPKLVTIGVEVPCRQISSSIRVEASNKQETFPARICRLPNGISESQ
jgi:hypothetical protein